MHRHVRDLYKRFLWVGREYPHPQGLAFVREKAKQAFQRNRDLAGEDALAHAVAKGRWWVKELQGVVQLRKYRAMRARYGDSGTGDPTAGLVERFERELRQPAAGAAAGGSGAREAGGNSTGSGEAASERKMA